MAWDVMSGVTKTAWDVLSGVANLCGMFGPGCQKMAWDVLSQDVLSGSRTRQHLSILKCSRPPKMKNIFVKCEQNKRCTSVLCEQ